MQSFLPLRARTRLAFVLAGSALLGCGSNAPTQGGGGDDDKDFTIDPVEADGGAGDPRKDAGKDAKVDTKTDAKVTPGKPIVPDDGENKCAGIRQAAPPATGGVDVIFIIDTSGSMLHAITQVRNNMAMFVQNFESTSADTRVVVITADDPARGTPVAMDRERYRFIRSEVDSKALYTVAAQRFDEYKDFLRPGAATQFVMVTDDNDIIAPASFVADMEKRLGHAFTQHAIASEDQDGHPCISEAQKANPLCAAPIPAVCAAAAIGKTYYQCADQTGGEKLSICKADWTEVFAKLRAAVIAAVPLPCSYPLSEASSTTFDPEKVAVVYTPADGATADQEQEFPKASSMDKCGSNVGWYYDNEEKPTTIQLCPAACTTVAAGGSMDVAFGCKPQIFL